MVAISDIKNSDKKIFFFIIEFFLQVGLTFINILSLLVILMRRVVRELPITFVVKANDKDVLQI